jgi:hypothetical protein
MVTSYQRNQVTSNIGVSYSSLIKTTFKKNMKKMRINILRMGS